MASPGEQLRTAREERGLTLEDVYAATHIRVEYLNALEQDDRAALPDDVVARGFVRNYARYLGLDPKPLVGEYGFEEVALPKPLEASEAIDVPLQISPIPSGAIVGTIALLIVIAVLVGGIWYVYPRRAELMDRFNQAAPVGLIDDATVTATQQPAATDTPVAIQGDTTEATETTTQPTNTPRPTATSTATPVPTATQPPRTPTPGADAPTTIAADEIRVVLQAQSAAWTRVMVDGEEAYAGTLEDGDEREWIGNETVLIRTGNAGGVRLLVNGEDYGILGDAGEVLDTLLRRDGETGQIVVEEPTPSPAPTTTG